MDDIQLEPTEVAKIAPISDEATEEQNQNITESIESAPVEEGSKKDERVAYTPEQQEVFDEAISKKVVKLRDAEWARDKAEKRLAEFQAQMPKVEAPVIPDPPDPEEFYDDPSGLKAAIQNRDDLVANRAKFDQEQLWQTSQLQQQAQQQAQVKAQEQYKKYTSYAETSETFGIKKEQYESDATIVGQSLPNQDVHDFLLTDPQGPLIVNYFAKNALALSEVRSMTPMQAAVYINNEIRPKLAGIKKTTSAPRPLDMDDGKGVPEKIDPRLEGATFS